MSKDSGKKPDWGIDEAASGLRKKGADFKDYLKSIHAEVEEWKFGVEESKDGFRVEWRVVAVVQREKAKAY